MKVLLQPTSKQIGTDNGVGQVLLYHERYLPQVGVDLVSEGESYDLSASHLGFNVNADVHHNHGLWLGGLESERADQNKLIVESVRRAKEVIVPSEYVANYFRRDMRLDPAVIGHGVEWEMWQDGNDKGYVLWDKNRKSAICDPAPVTTLAKAFPDTPFASTFAEDMTPNNVYTTGRIPFHQMIDIVKGTHIYLGTTKETFGIGTLQAMAAGAPVVGYDWGGTADIVRNGVDGVLVKPGDESALREALNHVLKHRDELGENARERAKHFSWLEVARRIQAVYARAYKGHNDDSVSVIIPCYDYADVLPRAVQSVAKQTYDNLREIIIVDDGSTDDTPQVARELMRRDHRIRYIRQTNGGVANARNTGISRATSTYVSCLDADDEMHPEFLETTVSALCEDRGIRLAYSKIELVFPNGDRGVGPWPDEFDPDAMLRGENQVPTCCVFYKEDWQRLGGYKQRYCPKGYGAEDAEFWLRFAKHGYRAKLVTDKPLFIYHLGGGTSKDYEEPNWLKWHTDLQTGWLPFSALSDEGVHAVIDYEDPTYSIVIPVGPGHEIYLEDALDSVEAQTDKRWECIVVWNMPADILITNPLIDRLHFAYPFVKFVVATDKQGAGYARNVGTEIAKGDYLVYLDADDYLQPRFLELTRKTLEHFDAGWVYTDIYTQTEEGIRYFECHEWDVQKLWRHGIMGVTCLYPRSAYDKVGGFDEEHNREDWDFHLRLARAGLCGLRVPIPLFTYRQQLGYRREYRKIATSAEESKAMKQEDVKRLHETFDVEAMKMACSGCGGKRVNIQAVSDDDLLTMEYVGRNQSMANEVTFRGPVTSTRYRTVEGTIINVHPQDAEQFEQRGLFKPVQVVKSSEPIVARTPRQPKVETEETWGEQQQRINDEMQRASDDARKATEEHLESLFGNVNPSEIPEWIKNPSSVTVSEMREHVEEDLPAQPQIAKMYRAEQEGKNRITALRFLRSYLPDDFDDGSDE